MRGARWHTVVVETTFFLVSILGLAFVVNAWRPTRSMWASVPVFFAGWLTAELAPLLLLIHVGAVTGFVITGALQGWQGWVALGLSIAIAVALVAIIAEAWRGRHIAERALTDALGPDYRDVARPQDRAWRGSVPWRRFLLPFWLWSRDVKRQRNIAYGEVRRRNLLDVYHHREKRERAPVLLYIHGGAWISVSNKDHQGKPLMNHLAEHGWVCVAPNYRLSPRATWPDHFVDVKRALAWVKQNVEQYGGDPDFVVLSGGSAGGHLASLLALTQNDPELQPGFEDIDTSVAACIPSYGVYDFTPDGGKFAAGRLRMLERMIFKQKYADDPEPFRRASPHHLVHENVPPFLVLHGGNDSLAPVDEARRFVERLRGVSKEPVVYIELDHTQHAFDVFHSIRTTHVVHAIERFCTWVWARYRASAGGGAQSESKSQV